jgi:thymidylate kinase
MLKRKKLVQSSDALRQAGKAAMMIFGQKYKIDQNDSSDNIAVAKILNLNSIPLVYLDNTGISDLAAVFKSEAFSTKYQAEQKRYNMWKEAFVKVKEAFLTNNIDYVFIKTPSFFPYTSGNLDVLVKEEDFKRAGTLLEEWEFIELKNIREPHKYLYKRFDLGEEIVAVHLHSRIFWGATFIDPKSVWSKIPRKIHDDVVFTLSAEDCLLTTFAHSFYENSAIKLQDLCIIKQLVENNKIDWNYLIGMVEQYRWKDGFSLTLLTYNHLHQKIFGSQLFPDDFLKEMELYTKKKPFLKKGIQRISESKATMPYYLPLLLSKYLLYKKIINSPEFGGILNRTWILAKTLFLTLVTLALKISDQMPILISFSGIDGSGKSSYALPLQKALENCGLRTNYIWTRAGSMKGFQSIRKLWVSGNTKSGSSGHSTDPEKQFHRMQEYLSHGWKGNLWRLVNIVDFCLFYNFKLRMELLRRHAVICDRYIPDILVDLYTYSKDNNMFWLKILSVFLPHPRVSLLLDVKPETALERSKDKDSLEFLNRQSELYNQIRHSLNLSIVNTQDKYKEVCNQLIIKTLKTYYSNKCVLYGWEQDK